jgi:hypothetical protein
MEKAMTLLKSIGILLFALLATLVQAESCDTDCHKQCRIKTTFPPVNFIEPTCHAKCEIAKKAACVTRSTIPNIPLTPREQVEQYGTQACAAITGAVIAQCSNWDGRTDDQHLIQQAAASLVSAGVILPHDLNGVQVRWCPLQGAHGMAPDRGRIYLDVSLKGNAFATASTLAHEVAHIRQYRAPAGTDRFKCEYSRQYLGCGGCQDRRNRFEREAYEFEDRMRLRISQAVQVNNTPQPQWAPPSGFPQQARSAFPSGFGMQVCGCWGLNPAAAVAEPRCGSRAVRITMCPGFCPGGGNPYAYVCQ